VTISFGLESPRQVEDEGHNLTILNVLFYLFFIALICFYFVSFPRREQVIVDCTALPQVANLTVNKISTQIPNKRTAWGQTHSFASRLL
jgi:hypothetical protein